MDLFDRLYASLRSGRRGVNHKVLAARFNDEVRTATENPSDKRRLYVKTELHIKNWIKEMDKAKGARKSLANIAADIKSLRKALRDNDTDALPVPQTVRRSPPTTTQGKSRKRSRRQRSESGANASENETACSDSGARGMQLSEPDSTQPGQTTRRRDLSPVLQPEGGVQPTAPAASMQRNLHKDNRKCSVCGQARYGRRNPMHFKGWCGVLGQWGKRAKCESCTKPRRVCTCGNSERLVEEIRGVLKLRGQANPGN